jgi:hypothetical protein
VLPTKYIGKRIKANRLLGLFDTLVQIFDAASVRVWAIGLRRPATPRKERRTNDTQAQQDGSDQVHEQG